MMETQKTIEALLDDLSSLSPDGAEYLNLFIDDIAPFNIDAYTTEPELANHSLPNIEDDVVEMIYLIDKSITEGVSKNEVQNILKSIFGALRGKPVTLCVLKPMFEHFEVLNVADELEKVSKNKPIRFRAPNLLFTHRELDSFYRACELIELTEEGKGSHTKWIDPSDNQTYGLSSRSKKSWFKNNIKNMLDLGFPITRIQKACAELKIDFIVISS